MGDFRFETRWTFAVPVRRLWQALIDPAAVAAGWDGVLIEAARDAKPLRKGAAIDWRIQSPLRTTLHVTTRVAHLDAHRSIHIQASGDLQGSGLCRIAPTGESSSLEFTWDVDATNRLFTILARLPGGRAILAWAHDRVMAAARRALETVLSRPEEGLNGL